MDRTTRFSSCTVSNSKCICFDLLTKDELDLINNNSIEVVYKQGEKICKHGTLSPHLILLTEGLAKVYLECSNNPLILKVITPGNLIGLTSVFEGNNIFHYSSKAYIESKAIQIDINIFRKVLSQNVAFANSIIKILCENSIQTFGRFYCFTHKQMYGRMADIILCLSEKIFKSDEFELNLSRKELAELMGMSTESVIRMLRKFKEDGTIQIVDKKLRVLDYDALRKVSELG
jgi:CRP/FNR family transcriptional regulator